MWIGPLAYGKALVTKSCRVIGRLKLDWERGFAGIVVTCDVYDDVRLGRDFVFHARSDENCWGFKHVDGAGLRLPLFWP
jgi:hypothetical protein